MRKILSLLGVCELMAIVIAFRLTTSDESLTLGENFTLVCSSDRVPLVLTFTSNGSSQCIITGANISDKSCIFAGSFNPKFIYSCNPVNLTYALTIPASFVNDSFHNSHWACMDLFGGSPSNTVQLLINIPISSVTFETEGDNSLVSVVTGDTHTLTCTTDLGRPAASIQWNIGGHNVTNLASLKVKQDGSKFKSTSTLVYTGREADHNKVVNCDASNIEGRTIHSDKSTIYIQEYITSLKVTPATINNIVTVVYGATQEFVCKTDSSRPAAWIQWYIGDMNVTSDAIPQPPQIVGTKFLASSKLLYTGKGGDNGKVVNCQGTNIEGRQKVKSINLTLLIGYRPEPVVEIHTICYVVVSVVMWRSRSNGGNGQMFQVVWQNLLSDLKIRSENVSDPGLGSIVFYSTTSLLPHSSYAVIIESTNIYGTVESSKQVYCNTTDAVVAALPVKEATFSAGFCSGAAVIVGINIVATIAFVVRKRKRRAPTDSSNVYEKTNNKTGDSSVYNELNEISRERQNPTDIGDITYEDIGVDTNKTLNTDKKRKRKGKKVKSESSKGQKK